MRLYHYTSRHHLSSILEAGELHVTESNVSMTQPHAGPDVVWLTSDPDLYRKGAQWSGRDTLPVDKLEIRFTVNVDDAVQWERWQRKRKVKRQWYVALVRAGGDHLLWYVVERAIPRSNWSEVRVMSEDLVLDVDSYMAGSHVIDARRSA